MVMMTLSAALLVPRPQGLVHCSGSAQGDDHWFGQKKGGCNYHNRRRLADILSLDINLVHLPGLIRLLCKSWQLWLLITVAIACSHYQAAYQVTGNPLMQVNMHNILRVYQAGSIEDVVELCKLEGQSPRELVLRGVLSPVEGEIVRELQFSYGHNDFQQIWRPKNFGLLKMVSEKLDLHLGHFIKPSETLARDFLYHAIGKGRDLPKTDDMVKVSSQKPEVTLSELDYHLRNPGGFQDKLVTDVKSYTGNLSNPAWDPEFLRLTPAQRANWIVMHTNFNYSTERGLYFPGEPDYLVTPIKGLTLTEVPWPENFALRSTKMQRLKFNSTVIQEIVDDVFHNASLADLMDCINGIESGSVLVRTKPFRSICGRAKLSPGDCSFLIRYVCSTSLASTDRSENGGLKDFDPYPKYESRQGLPKSDGITNDLTSDRRESHPGGGQTRTPDIGTTVPDKAHDVQAHGTITEDFNTQDVKLVDSGSASLGDNNELAWNPRSTLNVRRLSSVDESLAATEVNSPMRRLSLGYGDPNDWSMIEEEYPDLGQPTSTYVQLKPTPGKHNEVRSISSLKLRTFFNWPTDCSVNKVSFPKDLNPEWKSSSGKKHTLSWPAQTFELDGHGLCGSDYDKLTKDDKVAADELVKGQAVLLHYVGKALTNDQALFQWLSKEVDGSVWTGHEWVSAKSSIGCSAIQVRKTWSDDTSMTLQPDPRVCKNSDYPLYISTPTSFTTASFYTINETTTRPASEIFTTGGFYIARQSAIADFNPNMLDSSWFRDWSLFLAMDHCDLRCSFAPKVSFAASSSGIVTTDVPGTIIKHGEWHPVIKGAQIAPLCQAACSSAESLMSAGEQCIGTCSKVPVVWSTIGAEFGLKSRSDWIKSLRVTYASIGSLGQILSAESLPFGYLLLQLVFMLAEACYDVKRQPITVWIVSSALFVGGILYIGLFGPTTTAFIMSAFTITGFVLSFAATYVTAKEAIPVSEFSLMVMIFLIQGVASSRGPKSLPGVRRCELSVWGG